MHSYWTALWTKVSVSWHGTEISCRLWPRIAVAILVDKDDWVSWSLMLFSTLVQISDSNVFVSVSLPLNHCTHHIACVHRLQFLQYSQDSPHKPPIPLNWWYCLHTSCIVSERNSCRYQRGRALKRTSHFVIHRYFTRQNELYQYRSLSSWNYERGTWPDESSAKVLDLWML